MLSFGSRSRSLLALAALTLAACGTDAGTESSGEPDVVVLDDSGDVAGDAPLELGGDDVADAPDDVSDDASDAADASDAPLDVPDTSDANTDDDAVPDVDAASDIRADATDVADVAVDVSDAGADVVDVAIDVPVDVPDVTPPSSCGRIINGGAETGDIGGWTVERGSFSAVRGASTTPTAYEGTYSFFAGRDANSVLLQVVDVSDDAVAIDAGGRVARLDAQVRDWNGADDAQMSLTVLDADGATLATAIGGPWRTPVWTARTVALELPVGARSVAVRLEGIRRTGTDNDAYFDAVDVCLVDGPLPADAGQLFGTPYLMWVTDDAVSVRWETRSANVGVVRATVDGGEALEFTEDSARTTHEVRLEGLPAASTISYQVGWDGRFVDARTFRTAPEPGTGDSFSFVVWGDNQDGPEVFSQITPMMAALDPDFAISTGDCVQNGTRGEFRSQLFEPLAGLEGGVPFLVGAGNHERYSDSGAALFDEYMSQPGDEHCFGWRYGNAFFLFIDTELSVNPGSAQDTCIRDALASAEATSATFQAAVFHKPPRIEFWFGGLLAFPDSMEAPQVREILDPLFGELGVDIVFNGHNHLYALTPETTRGTAWVTTGGAGGMIDSPGAFSIWRVGTWPEITEQIYENHFLSVEVEGGAMTIRMIDMDGAVRSTYVLER